MQKFLDIIKRFYYIQKYLHFNNNGDFDSTSTSIKLFQIQPIINYLKQKFITVYIPDKNITLDETFIGWKGRLGWKQFIPSIRKI